MNIYRTLNPGLDTKAKVPIAHSPESLPVSITICYDCTDY